MYLLIITVYLIKLLLHGDATKYFICLVGLGEKVCSVHWEVDDFDVEA